MRAHLAVTLTVLAAVSCTPADTSDDRATAETDTSATRVPFALAPDASQAVMGEAGAATLCAVGETVLFSCRAGPRIMSVCGAADPSSGAQYRTHRGDTRELTYPAGDMAGVGTMRRATTGYSGGGEAQIQFDNGGYTYVVYSRVVRTRFDGEGNEPEFTAGVAVIKDDKTVGERLCTAPADVVLHSDRAAAYMPEGEIITIPEKDGQ